MSTQTDAERADQMTAANVQLLAQNAVLVARVAALEAAYMALFAEHVRTKQQQLAAGLRIVGMGDRL